MKFIEVPVCPHSPFLPSASSIPMSTSIGSPPSCPAFFFFLLLLFRFLIPMAGGFEVSTNGGGPVKFKTGILTTADVFGMSSVAVDCALDGEIDVRNGEDISGEFGAMSGDRGFA